MAESLLENSGGCWLGSAGPATAPCGAGAGLRHERSRVLADCSQVIRSRGWPLGQEVSCPPAEPDGFRDPGMAHHRPREDRRYSRTHHRNLSRPARAVKASAHPGWATDASPGSAARPARG